MAKIKFIKATTTSSFIRLHKECSGCRKCDAEDIIHRQFSGVSKVAYLKDAQELELAFTQPWDIAGLINEVMSILPASCDMRLGR